MMISKWPFEPLICRGLLWVLVSFVSFTSLELYALNTVIMEAKGVASFLEELHEYPTVEGFRDASATLAVAHRIGLGKLTHLAIRHLWLQDELRERRLVLHVDEDIEELGAACDYRSTAGHYPCLARRF